MCIESVPNRSSPPAVLLRESYRDGGRVKKRTLANLSKLPTTAIEALRGILRGEQLVHPDDAFTCVRSRPHGHVAAVLGTLKRLGLHSLLARGTSRVRDLVVALIVARVIDAQSKLATARALTPESAVSTLGDLLNLGQVDPLELYAAMDWLVERQAAIEQRLAKRHLQEHTLVLYDLTSSYVEGTHCELARRYKDLSKVERAFRSLKSVDLKVRPIYHRRADRVRAHVLLCMLAYYVEWHMRQDLAPLLFDDHDPAAAERQRSSVVRKAKRSPAARAKAARKRTAEDLPVHSFRTLLTDLGTTANTMQVADSDATFALLTEPTPVQQRCFELLGVTPKCSQ